MRIGDKREESVFIYGQWYMRVNNDPWLKAVDIGPGVTRWDEVTDPAELGLLEGDQ